MRIGIYYKWFKEGKIDCDKDEMSSLWKAYEKLNPRNSFDRKNMYAYESLLKKIDTDEWEEAEAEAIEKLNWFFEMERNDPKRNHMWILQ